jgi:hypothetical protein
MDWRALGLMALVILVAYFNIGRKKKRRAKWAQEEAEDSEKKDGQ